MEPIFSRDAYTVAWLKDGVVYDESGYPRALIRNEAVVSFEGEFIGWLHHGYFRDENGDAVAFMKGAEGGPTAPSPRVVPTAPTTWAVPNMPTIRVAPEEKPPTLFWSEMEWHVFMRVPVETQ